MTESPRADLNKDPEEIASMFDSVASRYDVMDALMTGGLDRVWMTALRKAVAPHPGERILDLAAGTGASSAALAKGGAEVVACDLSEGMIEVGRERHPELEFVHGNAMDLDFEDGSFDAVTISWGLRNIPDPALALRLANRLTGFWSVRGHFSEGRRRVGELLRRVRSDDPERVDALNGAAWLATSSLGQVGALIAAALLGSAGVVLCRDDEDEVSEPQL